MRRYLITALICFAIAIVAGLHIGCATEPFHKKVQVCLDVHIVSDISQYDYKPYQSASMGVAGYATNKVPYEIWVLGDKHDGQYNVNMQTLGHEFAHILNWKDYEVRDPHDYLFFMK